MPSLVNDGEFFFPNVLKTESFKKNGYLYQEEQGAQLGALGLHWAVIDPRKHKLYIWEKNVPHYTKAAISLNATVVTNGPFFRYTTKNTTWGAIKVALSGARGFAEFTYSSINPVYPLLNLRWSGVDLFFGRIDDSIKANFSADSPIGHIHGERDGIHLTPFNNKPTHYFGRKSGRQFEDYVMAQDNPNGLDEVIGGLYRVLEDYTVINAKTVTNQHGFWGLAPVDPANPVWDEAKPALAQALEEISIYDNQNNNDLPPMTGVLITVFQQTTPSKATTMMKRANVKDAVELDRSDSVLLAVNRDLKVGESMLPNKEYGNTWGFRFDKE